MGGTLGPLDRLLTAHSLCRSQNNFNGNEQSNESPQSHVTYLTYFHGLIVKLSFFMRWT